MPVLRDFLALLPAEQPAAFEFRNASLFDDEVYDALREAGAALVVFFKHEDAGAGPAMARQLVEILGRALT